jgi:hypothetical protein
VLPVSFTTGSTMQDDERPVGLSCLVGLFGLSGPSRLFDLSRLFS